MSVKIRFFPIDKYLLKHCSFSLLSALVDMILLIALTVGNLVAGIFLQKYGFLLSFFVAFCLYVASLLYTVFILKESHPKSQRCKSSRTCLAEPIMIIDVIRKRRPGRSSLLLLTIIGEIHTKRFKLFESLFSTTTIIYRR